MNLYAVELRMLAIVAAKDEKQAEALACFQRESIASADADIEATCVRQITSIAEVEALGHEAGERPFGMHQARSIGQILETK